MANRFPLIVNTTSGNSVQELPSGDFLDLSNSGISNSGNISVSGIVSATGNITGNYILGNGSQLSGIIASVANINSGTSNVTVVSSGGNVTVGIGGTSNVVQFATTGVYVTGIVSATGNITGGNLSGTNLTGTLATAAQTNITSVGTLSSLSVTGNVVAGNVNATLNGSGANVTSISATNISSGTLAQARLANTSLTVNGTSIALGGSGTVTATATGTLTIGTGLGGTSYNGSTGVTITNTGVTSLANGGGITASVSTGAVTLGSTATNANTASAIVARDASGNFSAGTITATLSGSATTAGTVTTAAQGNITSVGTLSALTVSGAITVNSSNAVTAIVNGGTAGVGNIGASGQGFNTIFAKATSAQYADLAENYEADADYAPGTVVVFGGNKEITVTNNSHDTAVAGIISTNPSYLMNAGQSGEWILPVALTGRVPCRVQGPVNKGTVLVTGDIPGTAMAIKTSKFAPGCVVGKSLEIINSTDVLTIEVAVGRL